MNNLTLKIKSYQEYETYLTVGCPSNLSEDQLISLALDALAVVNKLTNPLPSTPNIIRFENASGIYNYELKQIVEFI